MIVTFIEDDGDEDDNEGDGDGDVEPSGLAVKLSPVFTIVISVVAFSFFWVSGISLLKWGPYHPYHSH